MATLANMSDLEIDGYVMHFRATASTLSSALAMFHFRAMNAPTSLERNEAARDAIITRRDLDVAEMQFSAATKNNGSVRAPSKLELDEAVARATALAKVNAVNAKTSAFLDVATKAATAFSQLHPNSPAMAASPLVAQAIAALEHAQTLLPGDIGIA